MATGVSLNMIDDKGVVFAMKTLRASVRRGVFRQSVRSALSPINKEAKRLVPKDSGALKSAIAIKVKTYAKTGAVVGMVGVIHNKESKGKIPNYYAQRIEYGHDYRSPDARKGKRTYRQYVAPDDAKKIEIGTSSGAAQPFLRPAIQNKRGEALSILSTKAKQVLLREVAKAEAKGRSVTR